MKSKYKLSLSQQVLIVSTISFIWIIIYKLLFLDMAELFPKAHEISEILYGLSASIVASSIFYYIVVYRSAKQKLDKVRKHIFERVCRFELDKIMILKDIYSLKGLKIPKEIPERWEDFRDVCDGIILTDKAPIIFGNPSYKPKDWFEYFEYYFIFENSNKEMLKDYWDDVPIEVKTLLEELQTNTFQSGIRTYKLPGYSKKLYDLAGPLWNHLRILSTLPETLNENLKV